MKSSLVVDFTAPQSIEHLFVNHQQLWLTKTSSIGPIVHGQRTVTVNELFTNHFEFVVRNPSVYIELEFIQA